MTQTEIRNLKSEGRKKAEMRRPKFAGGLRAPSPIRISGFGFLSEFGIRILGFRTKGGVL